MAQKKKSTDGYLNLVESIKGGRIGNLYVFHGDERYLLERCLGEIRKKLCPDGLDSFNYKRFEGRSVTLDVLDEAINTVPAFAERTLVEIHDYDIFKSNTKPELSGIFSELPEYVCLLFIYDTLQYKPDGRKKQDAELLANAEVVEFTVADQLRLVKWIKRHFEDAGKRVSTDDAEYLALLTGGLMTTLSGEIEKVAAYAKGETVTREDIDALVIPTPDTAAYKLADALLRREHIAAMRILDELLRMREAPHKLMFGISLKMRQLLAARVCIDNNSGKEALMDMCGIRHDFQARALMDTARKTTLARICGMVSACSETAFALNTGNDPEASMIELIAKLAHS